MSIEKKDDTVHLYTITAPGCDPDFPDTGTIRSQEVSKRELEQDVNRIQEKIEDLVNEGKAQERGEWITVSSEVAEEENLFPLRAEPPRGRKSSVGGGREDSSYNRNWERIFKGENN